MAYGALRQPIGNVRARANYEMQMLGGSRDYGGNRFACQLFFVIFFVIKTGSSPPSASVEDDARGFFRNHINGADDEKPRDAGENRGINNPQSLRAMNAKIASQDSVVLPSTDGTSTRSMVSPSIVADKFAYLLVRLNGFSRRYLLLDEALIL